MANYSSWLFVVGILIIFIASCKKDDNINPEIENSKTLASIETLEVSGVTDDSAVSGGNITDDGGEQITSRGVCWSIKITPTINDNKTNDGTGIGYFKSVISNLEPTTTYYLRAYATNSLGTSYGNTFSFTTRESSGLPPLKPEFLRNAFPEKYLK